MQTYPVGHEFKEKGSHSRATCRTCALQDLLIAIQGYRYQVGLALSSLMIEVAVANPRADLEQASLVSASRKLQTAERTARSLLGSG